MSNDWRIVFNSQAPSEVHDEPHPQTPTVHRPCVHAIRRCSARDRRVDGRCRIVTLPERHRSVSAIGLNCGRCVARPAPERDQAERSEDVVNGGQRRELHLPTHVGIVV